jgi:membrane associated rhomboid family serine protease
MPEIDFRRTPVTILLAIAIIALEIVCTLDPERRSYYYQTCHLGLLPTVWDGELWQPFTTALLHAGLLHAAFHVCWLWIFGQVLEPRFGSPRFLLVCVLLSYASMLSQFIVANYSMPPEAEHGVVGFSGVNYGLFGMLWVGRRWEREFYSVCNQATVRLMLSWFVLCIVLTHADLMPVANIAHGSGMLFGVLFGLACFAPARRWAWRALATLATTAVLATLIACPGHEGYKAMREIQRWRALEKQLNALRCGPPGGESQHPGPAGKNTPGTP